MSEHEIPACPYSRDRLHELLWEEPHWTPDQIAVLASAQLDAAVTPAHVRAWMDAAGVAPREARVKPAPPSIPAPRSRKALAGGATMQTRACTQCARAISRPAWRFRSERQFCNTGCLATWRESQQHRMLVCEQCSAEWVCEASRRVLAHVFCGEPCAREFRREQARARAIARAAKPTATELAAPKQCPRCGIQKTRADFSADRNRSDGRARICLLCNKAKGKAYYAANQARLQEAARVRKQAARAALIPAMDPNPNPDA